MPEKLILRDVSVMVDGTTLTESARSVEIIEEADRQDTTAFGGSGYREEDVGLITGRCTIEFFQGFDANGVFHTLRPIWDNKEAVEVRIGPKGPDGAADNPVWAAMCKLFSFSHLRGAVGEASLNPVEFSLTEAPFINTT